MTMIMNLYWKIAVKKNICFKIHNKKILKIATIGKKNTNSKY